MADPDASGEIRAAGAVIWRPGDPGGTAESDIAGLQVAVIHRPKYDDWSFAKGKLQPGEHVLRAAVREVFEETGLRVTLGPRLNPVRYSYREITKRVDYWAASAVDSSLPFVANQEVDELEWLPVAQARERLSYGRDVELLAEFSAGPARTAPLILLRHASSGSRTEWHDDDLSRPLDAVGAKDARDLVGLLSCFGVLRVISSPAERCLATVRPYAESAGLPVETDPGLAVSDGGLRPSPDAAAAVAARLAAAGDPAVVCAHRENLPVLLEAAVGQLGGPSPGGPPLSKGEFWVLHTSNGRLAGAERHLTGVAGLAPQQLGAGRR